MNSPDDTPTSSGLWCYPDHIAGEADANNNNLPSMFIDYSNDDLFDLVWQQGRYGGDVMMEQAAVSCHRQSPRLAPPVMPVHEPDEVLLPDPPSEDQMASWLSAIVKGEEHARDGDRSGWRMLPGKECVLPSMTTVTEGMDSKDIASDCSEKSKAAAGGARRSHHGETHNLTEKRRRCKINDRLKTLQQLVPGCDKSNHATTLEQTIQYMKWLQHQVQAMSAGPPPGRPPAATTTAVYPVVQPPAGVAPVVLGPLPMVPFRPLVPCAASYPVPVVLVPAAAAAAPPLYPAPAAAHVPGTAPATAVTGPNHRHGSRRNKLNRSRSSSVRHKA